MLADIRLPAAAYRAATAVIAGVAISRVINLGTPSFAPGGILYYTSMSNLLGMAWSLCALITTLITIAKHARNGTASVHPRIGAGIGLALLVTLLIYLVILAPSDFTQSSSYQPFTLTDNLVHIIVPLLVTGDWVLFAKKGALRWWDPLWWALIPYTYVAFAYIRPFFTEAEWPGGGHYPYPFLDIDQFGRRTVFINLAVLTLAVEIIAFLMVIIDRGLVARRISARVSA